MPDGDTITLLTRYPHKVQCDQRENRLTAAFVALLKLSPGIAAQVARSWVPTVTTGARIKVTFQRAIGTPVGWVDIEMLVRTPQRPCVIWVEAKLGARLSGSDQPDQLQRYQAAMRKRYPDAERRVLLLAPRWRRDDFAVPELVPSEAPTDEPSFVAWQDVYRIIKNTREHQPHVEWLRREVLAHMMTEQLETVSLTAARVSTLSKYAGAVEALRAVLARAAELIAPQFGTRDGHKTEWENYWEYRYLPRHRKDGGRTPGSAGASLPPTWSPGSTSTPTPGRSRALERCGSPTSRRTTRSLGKSNKANRRG